MSVFLRLSDAERESWQILPQSLHQAYTLFLEHGCLVLQNVFPQDFIQGLSESFAAELAASDRETLWNHSIHVGPKRLITPLPLKGPFGDSRFYAHPGLCALLDKLMDPTFLLNSCSVVLAMPGAEAQRTHRDNDLLFGHTRASLTAPAYAITVGMPLMELTAETGTTALYPGSHQELLIDRIYATPPVEPMMQLGDVYLFDCRLIHNGTPNASPHWRPIVYLTYTRHWFIDVENYFENDMNAIVADAETMGQVPASRPEILSRARFRLIGGKN